MKAKSTFLLFIIFPYFTIAQNIDHERNDVIKVIEYFQEGYTNRDTSILAGYVQKLFTDDIVIIGTGNSEFPIGIQEAARLIKMDWKYWGDVKINIGNTIIRAEKKNAWVIMQGTLTRNFETEEYIFERFGLQDIDKIKNKEISNKLKLLEIITDASELLREVETAGTEFVYPLRIVASLVKIKDQWKFKQMGFSYPYPRKPIIRNN